MWNIPLASHPALRISHDHPAIGMVLTMKWEGLPGKMFPFLPIHWECNTSRWYWITSIQSNENVTVQFFHMVSYQDGSIWDFRIFHQSFTTWCNIPYTNDIQSDPVHHFHWDFPPMIRSRGRFRATPKKRFRRHFFERSLRMATRSSAQAAWNFRSLTPKDEDQRWINRMKNLGKSW